MDPLSIVDISKESILVLIKISAPILLIALTVGLIISLFQALTQIQESTLSFVPKILVIFVSLIFFMPYMMSHLQMLFEHIMEMIVG